MKWWVSFKPKADELVLNRCISADACVIEPSGALSFFRHGNPDTIEESGRSFLVLSYSPGIWCAVEEAK